MQSEYVLQGDLDGMSDVSEALTGWSVDLAQTDAGKAGADILLFQSAGVQLFYGRLDRGYVHVGSTPDWGRTFQIQVAPESTCSGYGREYCGNDVLAFPESGELAIASPAGLESFSLTIASGEMERIREDLGCDDLFKRFEEATVFRFSSHGLEALKGLLMRINTHVRQDFSASHFTLIREDLLSIFTAGLASVCDKPRILAPNSRQRAVRRATDFILSGAQENIALADLCHAVGVSERTLLYAFKQEFGISPKAYLKSYRLRGAYRELLRSRGVSVTSVASRWGFWHMGQFGADYKRAFGELPSTTLVRTPSPVQSLVPVDMMTV